MDTQTIDTLYNRRVEYGGFIWNLLASSAAALSSVGTLLIVTRALGVTEAAIFSLATAIVTVLMNVGLFNVIGFQITDVTEKYSFFHYLKFRKITVTLMIFMSIVYVLYSNYDGYKSKVVVLYCIYKAVNVYCDVYQGRYQQKGRMDLASRLNFFKVAIPDVILCSIVIVFKNLLSAILIAIIVEALYILLFNKKNFADFNPEHIETRWRHIRDLCWNCLPLFFGAFSSAYILNSSKYAIDKCMAEQFQTYYAILLLPATTVHMFAGFIYRPLLTKFAYLWAQHKNDQLKKIIGKIVVFILVLGLLVCIVGVPVGLPLLAYIYGVDELKQYADVFIVLLAAGTLNALNVLQCYLLTMMRLQKSIYIVYGITLAAAFLLTNLWVQALGLIGAAVSFLLLMILQLIGNFYIMCKKGFQELSNEAL